MINDYKLLVSNKNFLKLWSSQVLSQVTISIMNFTLLIRLFTLTGSSIATSLLWVSYSIPAILIGPFASATVDLTSRRRMLILTNLLQALTIFLYAFLHQTTLFLLYGVAFTYSLLDQFYVPAEAASLPSLVKRDQLPHANALFLLTQQSSLAIGFGTAGFLNQLLGFDRTLFLGAFFLFLAFISVTFLPELKARETLPSEFEHATEKFFEKIFGGYHFLREHRSVLLPFLMLVGIQIASTIVVVNVPVLARDIFQINLTSGGILIVVPAALGAISGAFIVGRLLKRGWRKKRAIETFLTSIVASILVLIFVVPAISTNLRLILGPVVVYIAALSFVGVVIPSQTYLQETTPGGLRGRVFGNFWFIVTVATIVPVIFSGTIIEIFGVKLIMLLLAVVAGTALFISTRFGEHLLSNNFEIKLKEE